MYFLTKDDRKGQIFHGLPFCIRSPTCVYEWSPTFKQKQNAIAAWRWILTKNPPCDNINCGVEYSKPGNWSLCILLQYSLCKKHSCASRRFGPLLVTYFEISLSSDIYGILCQMNRLSTQKCIYHNPLELGSVYGYF